MLLVEILQLKAVLKLEKADKIKLLHQLIFDSDENWQNRKNLRNFEGFQFQLDSDEFKAKLQGITNKPIYWQLKLMGMMKPLLV